MTYQVTYVHVNVLTLENYLVWKFCNIGGYKIIYIEIHNFLKSSGSLRPKSLLYSHEFCLQITQCYRHGNVTLRFANLWTLPDDHSQHCFGVVVN